MHENRVRYDTDDGQTTYSIRSRYFIGWCQGVAYIELYRRNISMDHPAQGNPYNTLSPPLNGGIFGASVPYTAVR